MNSVTQLLSRVESGDQVAAEELLPLVYEELRRLATQRLSHEKPGQSLQATALVHEAYLRLVSTDVPQDWNGRGHFFAAAAEAMRRILVENARRKKSAKRGGHFHRADFDPDRLTMPERHVDLIALDEALDQLATHDHRKAQLVKLRYFAGLTIDQAAEALGIAPSTANADWAYAKSWLRVHMGG
jgi:RNA polymerase sigma factor (TIGR02999 family)